MRGREGHGRPESFTVKGFIERERKPDFYIGWKGNEDQVFLKNALLLCADEINVGNDNKTIYTYFC
jgi:hypothetical protein